MKQAMQKGFTLVVVVVVCGLGWSLVVQKEEAPSPEEQKVSAQESPISATGLLPIYGITLDFDKSWVDGKKFPSPQPNFGVSDASQQLWDNRLKACGFNVLCFPVDVRQTTQESIRLANLCVWAKQNNVKLAPILIGSDKGQPLPKDYATKAGNFVRILLTWLKGSKGQHFDAYAQIMFYQLEYPLNHPAVHGTMDAAAAAELLQQTAANIRKAEQSGLKETQMQPTPLMVSVSFDYELIKGGAIFGAEISDDAYQQAYETIKSFLAGFADAQEIGMFSVEWFPGSLSAKAVERLPDLMGRLTADLPGKLLVMTTGYSTGIQPQEEQVVYYTLAFSNLADLRAGEGVDTPFAGILWHTALDGADAEAAPPTENILTEMEKWDWTAKAQELVQMWQDPKSGSEELRWWLKKVENNFGLLTAVKDEAGKLALMPKQAYEMLVEAHTEITRVAAATGAQEAAGQLKEEAMKAGERGAPDLRIVQDSLSITPSSTELRVGQAVAISLSITNAGTAPAENASAILTDSQGNTLAYSSSMTVPPNETKQVTISWTPTAAGTLSGVGVLLQCPGELEATLTDNVALIGDGNLTVSAGEAVEGGAPDLRIVQDSLSITPSPTELRVGQMVTISLSITNAGTAPGENASAILVDSQGNNLAYSFSMTISPNDTKQVTISWTPQMAGMLSGVRVMAYCQTEPQTTLTDNEALIGDGNLTVSDSGEGGGGGSENPFVQELKGKLQGALSDILTALIEKAKMKIIGGGGGGEGIAGGESIASGGIPDLRLDSITPQQLTDLQVGKEIQLTVTMSNQGTAEAADATAYLVDSTGYALPGSSANPSSITVVPGEQKTVTISWTPQAGGNLSGVKVSLYCPNDSNPANNEMTIGDGNLTVSEPGGGGGTGTPDLRLVSFTINGSTTLPTGLKAGQTVTISVTMSNAGTGDAVGATAYLAYNDGTNNQSLASSSPSKTIAPGGTETVTFSWTAIAGTFSGVSVMVLCTNEPESTLTDNGTVIGDGNLTVAEGAGSGGEVPFKFKLPNFGKIPIFTDVTSRIQPGFLNIGRPMSGTEMRAMSGQLPSGFQPGRVAPINLPVTNPFNHSFDKVKATLIVDGKPIATKELGTLLPKQRRTVMFSQDWTPPKAGTYKVEVKLEGVGPGGKVMSGSVEGKTVVGALPAAPVSLKMIKPPTVNVPSISSEQKLTSGSLPQPPTAPTRSLSPFLRMPRLTARVGSSPFVGTGQSLEFKRLEVRRPTQPDIRLSSEDIRFSRFPPPVGEGVSVSVNLFNRGNAPAQGVKVELFMDDQRLGAVSLDVPNGQLRTASGFQWRATEGRHTAKAVVIIGTQRLEASKPFEVRKELSKLVVPRVPVRLTLPPSQPMLMLRDLDIHLTPPAPSPGQSVNVTVNIRNQGGTEARGVQVEAFVDTSRAGRVTAESLGKVTVNIGANQTALVGGFSRWTASEGTHTIRIVATLGTQRQQASKSVTVGAQVLRPLILTRPVLPPTGVEFSLVLTENDIRLTPLSPKPGERVSITVDVRNQGQKPAQNVQVEIFVDITKLGEQTLPSIAAGQTQTVRGFPQWTATAGRHTIRVVISVGTYRREARKYIQVSEPRGITPVVPVIPGLIIGKEVPDLSLAAADITYTPINPKVGDTLTFTVTVRNIGKGDAKGATLTFSLQADGKDAGKRDFTLDVKANGSQTQRWTIRVPDCRQLRFTAKVAHGDDKNTRNNEASVTVNVQPRR